VILQFHVHEGSMRVLGNELEYDLIWEWWWFYVFVQILNIH